MNRARFNVWSRGGGCTRKVCQESALRRSEPYAIPRERGGAIAAVKGSAFLADALGPDVHRTFTAIRAAEHARVAATTPDVDYDLYLHTV